MPRRFNWKQEGAHQLVDEYLTGKIPSARNLYNRMRDAGLRVSKNTVYARVRADLRKKRQRPRIALLAVPKPASLCPDQRGNFRLPWQSQSVLRVLDSYITYKKEKSLREIGLDLGTLFQVPPIKKEALKNHVLDRRRYLNERPGGIRRFDRVNFEPQDEEYYDMKGEQLCSQIDEWFDRPFGYVKWEKGADEEISERWFQTVRAKLVEDVAQTSSTSTTKRGDEKSVSIQKQIEELHNAELKIPQTIVDSEQIEPKLVPLSHDYKVRLIRHDRQLHRSFIVEEHPGRFYHYIKRHTITAECSECLGQWRRHRCSGQIGRLVIAERSSKVLEIVSGHHVTCQPRTETEIRRLEVMRNVGDALQGEDEMDVFEKVGEMAQIEIDRLKQEEKNQQIKDYEEEYRLSLTH